MEDNNEFAATLEQRLKDIPCADEINKIMKDVRQLKLSPKLAEEQEHNNPTSHCWKSRKPSRFPESLTSGYQKREEGNVQKDSSLEKQIEITSTKHVKDLRLASYEARQIFAVSDLDILNSLKGKWKSLIFLKSLRSFRMAIL
ncbi:hypothetical protein F2Q69_00022228 [Brassica cretica]|uniref:Uncharacterized protein n=1 Tax=Brassica cretica TaxID=69181 RepID=A0A8S9QKN6_BRACR|nr:hypothetical protein F2Q69_00022228 [Brassica cretica]